MFLAASSARAFSPGSTGKVISATSSIAAGTAGDSISARAQVLQEPASRSRLLALSPAPELVLVLVFSPRPRSPEAPLRTEAHPRQCAAVASSLHGKEPLILRSTLSSGQGGDALTTSQNPPRRQSGGQPLKVDSRSR